LASDLEKPRCQFAILEPDNCPLASDVITTEQHAACTCWRDGDLLGFGDGTSIHITERKSPDQVFPRSQDEDSPDYCGGRTSAWCHQRFV
jgi:hypothetical protein